MAKRRESMSEGKKNIIASLIQDYDIKTAEDIQDALKDLLGGTIQSMSSAQRIIISFTPRFFSSFRMLSQSMGNCLSCTRAGFPSKKQTAHQE